MAMLTLTLENKYVDILKDLDSSPVEIIAKKILTDAVQHYALERINERITKARQQILFFETKYGLVYEEFQKRISADTGFVQQLEQADPVWDLDLETWHYYIEVLSTWLGRLQNISKM